MPPVCTLGPALAGLATAMVLPTVVAITGLATTHHGRLLCSPNQFTAVAGTAVVSGRGAVVVAAVEVTTVVTGAAMVAGAVAGSLLVTGRFSNLNSATLGHRPDFLTF